MKPLKHVLPSLLGLILFAAVVSGCSPKTASGNIPKQADKGSTIKVSLATGGTSGTYYPIGAAITAIITKYVPGVEATAESTGASVANLKMIREKKVDFILGAANTSMSAFLGEAPFEDRVDNIRGIAALYPETFQFLVRKDSGMSTVADLKGKKVAVGSPGSGSERTAKLLIEAYGMRYEDVNPQYLSFSEGVTALKDRLIDCAIVGAGIPTSAVIDASATMDISLLSVDRAALDKMLEIYKYLMEVTIPEGTYKGVNKDVVTIASPALFTTHKDMDETIIYQVTKAMFEHVAEIQGAHAQGRSITLDNALKGMSIPLHPGAEKFYKEKGISR